MVLSRFSAPLITLAPAPPPICLFIPMPYSFNCNADNFDKVRHNLHRIESDHKGLRAVVLPLAQQETNANHRGGYHYPGDSQELSTALSRFFFFLSSQVCAHARIAYMVFLYIRTMASRSPFTLVESYATRPPNLSLHLLCFLFSRINNYFTR